MQAFLPNVKQIPYNSLFSCFILKKKGEGEELKVKEEKRDKNMKQDMGEERDEWNI